MRLERLVSVFRIYLGCLLFVSLALYWWLHLDRTRRPERYIVSVWQGGQRRARVSVTHAPEGALREAARARGAVRVIEDVLDGGPVLFTQPFLFAMSFVPGRDAIEASYAGKVAYATPDDLLKIGAYELGAYFGEFKIKFGVDALRAQAFLAKELGVPLPQLLAHGRFRRLAVTRRVPGEPPPIWRLTPENVRESVVESAQYLARGVRPNDTLRYEVNAATGEDSEEYNLPRHAGTTWYIAQVAAMTRDRALAQAARRGANYLLERLVQCGREWCIAEDERADLGSSALAALGFTELVQAGFAPELVEPLRKLTSFLRSQQRSDGEFKHLYARDENRAVDVQFLYYSGEAAFALARAFKVTFDRRDLTAAREALAYQVKKPWWYIGWRYYWAAEHWTCHALDALWDLAPNAQALEYCMDWQEWVRNTAIHGREAAPEYEYGATSGPFVAPQVIVSASRMEAAVATLATARRAKLPEGRVRELEEGIRGTLAFMMRFQFLPGPAHLMPDPAAMRGGFATSETDLRVRIDTAQHAGTGLLEYLSLLEDHSAH